MKLHKHKAIGGKDFKLSRISTHPGKQIDTEKIIEDLAKDVEEIAKYQNKLYAENRQSLLIILQGMDSSGKDGTIKHIMHGVNPQGVNVCSFKHPSDLELEHDYLWRHAIKLPARGQITIFNRSQYENVLISKVHPTFVLAERIPGIDHVKKIDTNFWKQRYEQINNFETNIVQNGTQVLKFFLHLSKEEQRKRFLARIEQKEKHWKFSSADITERGFWDQYQDAYEQALQHTSTKDAPWYIIPADDKLYAHSQIGKIILETLKAMDPAFPAIDKKEKALMDQAKKELTKK
jgi:PPK2 family polyphosphate:nucleotide phosphotransferase